MNGPLSPGARTARLRWARPVPPIGPDFAAIRAELDVPGPFPAEANAEAQAAAAAPAASSLPDHTDLALQTVDPPGSTDLDQAMHIERDGSGYIVSYAIADVAAFVRPGGPLDRAAHARVETYYLPDGRSPLHPPALSEGAASLLADQDRPAVLWRIALNERGESIDVDVRRARVRSRRQWDYPQLQEAIDSGAECGGLALLAEVGPLRERLASERGAIDLDLPEQIVQPDGTDGWALVLRQDLPVERWNAQISLLTGASAASLMIGAGVGILRTLPEAEPEALARLRTTAAALGVDWHRDVAPGAMLAGLDRSDPAHLALVEHAASLLRGAGYAVLGAGKRASGTALGHAGVGSPYAHVTAPLRRLVDRYALEICVAIAAGIAPPEWAVSALAGLPAEMAHGDRRAHAVDRAAIDATEAWLLSGQVGASYEATVVEAAPDGASGVVALARPPVRARCTGPELQLGQRIMVRLTEADLSTRTVRFEAAPSLEAAR